VDLFRRQQADTAVPVLGVVPLEDSRQKSFASAMLPKRPGKPGWYLMVLKCASEYGLSFETMGRPRLRLRRYSR